jgi:hypothetical protein
MCLSYIMGCFDTLIWQPCFTYRIQNRMFYVKLWILCVLEYVHSPSHKDVDCRVCFAAWTLCDADQDTWCKCRICVTVPERFVAGSYIQRLAPMFVLPAEGDETGWSAQKVSNVHCMLTVGAMSWISQHLLTLYLVQENFIDLKWTGPKNWALN